MVFLGCYDSVVMFVYQVDFMCLREIYVIKCFIGRNIDIDYGNYI